MSDFIIVFLFGTDVSVILVEKVFAKISPLRNRRELIVTISVY
jgi:hypothetical protein